MLATPKFDFDVIVLGGGPAGTSAALGLSHQGWKVALLEKQSFPRPKLCGEFISPDGVRLLEALGLATQLEHLRPAPVVRSRITFPRDPGIVTKFESPGWGLSRSALDWALFKQAERRGALCLQKCFAESVDGDLTRGFAVQAVLDGDRPALWNTRAVIDATGRWSNFNSRNIRSKSQADQGIFLGVKAHFRGDLDLNHAVELHFFDGGYCGLNEIEDHEINLCALINQDRVNHGTRDWRQFLDEAGIQNPYLKDRLQQIRPTTSFLVTSPVVFGRGPKVAGEIIRAGDAAGFLDPFSGDGIATALRSGQMASDCLHGFLSGKATAAETIRRYNSEYNREFRRRFVFAQLIRKSLATTTMPYLYSRVARRIPAVGRWLVRQTRGEISRSTSPLRGSRY